MNYFWIQARTQPANMVFYIGLAKKCHTMKTHYVLHLKKKNQFTTSFKSSNTVFPNIVFFLKCYYSKVMIPSQPRDQHISLWKKNKNSALCKWWGCMEVSKHKILCEQGTNPDIAR